jgi:hypothetical protein
MIAYQNNIFKRMVHAALASGALLAPLYVHAQASDDDMCRSGGFPFETEFSIATVAPGAQPRLHFHTDVDGCPGNGRPSCQAKAFVVPGDKLLLSKTRGEWACAWYQGKSHETTGWVQRRYLVEQPQAARADWAGKWKMDGSPGYISIANKDGGWYVLGETRQALPNTENLGEIRGELKVNGNHAHLGGQEKPDGFDCVADFTRAGEFLIVRDNESCGGVNVRFNGVYTRPTSASRDGGSTGKARSRW